MQKLQISVLILFAEPASLNWATATKPLLAQIAIFVSFSIYFWISALVSTWKSGG